MVFKFDIEHTPTGRLLTFGPRFKGEVGKDIFAAKIALGLLKPVPSSGGELESGVEISYDTSIPLDDQDWFDCATGLGVDLAKATKFDTTLENALLSYQIKNQFLIVYYYFEKFGYLNLLDYAMAENEDTILEARTLSEVTTAMTLFESELRTLGEATLAILHGWLPGTRLTKNSSYTHDEEVYASDTSTVYDLIPETFFRNMLDPEYSQNFSKLVEQGIAVPNSLVRIPEYDDIYVSNLAASKMLFSNINFSGIQYYPQIRGTSRLFAATNQVVEYYLENGLFSETLSPEQIAEQARRAIYPDPFSGIDLFSIDNERLGIYLDTDYFLTAQGPLPPTDPNSQIFKQIVLELEEKALIKALEVSGKPKIWYFAKEDIIFKSIYFSGINIGFSPNHSGYYPSEITPTMFDTLKENYGDLYPPPSDQMTKFKRDNFWVLTTSDVISQFPEGDNNLYSAPVEYWRIIDQDNLGRPYGATMPLIEFKEFITPSLRPGQSYKALFIINKQKFEAITEGENLVEENVVSTQLDISQTESSICLDQNAEQIEKTYEEYRSHAIKRRRELVRKIREAVRENRATGGRVNLGGFSGLPMFEGFNIDAASDYELMQQFGQFLTQGGEGGEGVNRDFAAWQERYASDARDKRKADPDNDTNEFLLTVEELKERIDLAGEDLKEAQEVISRERIKFEKGTDFNGPSEAIHLNLFFESFLDQEFAGKKYDNLSKSEKETQITIKFENVNIDQLGHTSGKNIVYLAPSGKSTKPINELKKAYPRARTNNYVAQLKDMTAWPKLVGFFDDSRNSCKDLGLNVDKITAYAFVAKYTSGLKAMPRKDEQFSFKSWFEDNAIDPIREFGASTAQNFEDSFDPSNFPEDAALRALGAECDLEKVWKNVFDKLDIVSLLCDYVKCIKLPSFDFTAPNFRISPPPVVPILGWYAGFYNFVKDNYEQILNRLACTASKLIIDKLAFPFCEEQLQDFIQNDLLSENPYARQAVIDSLIKTGVPGEKSEDAKNFFDATSNILTGRELCYILEGNRPDDSTISSIQKLASVTGVSEYLQTPEDIVNFFGVVGTYLPDEICEQLNNQVTLRPTKCDDVNDLLRGVRNRLQTQDSTLTEQEINDAVKLAEQNKQQDADRLRSFLENGIDGLVPPIFEYGNKNSPMSDYPEYYKKMQQESVEALFKGAKKQYAEGLAQFVPAMYIGSPVDLWPYDERYDQWEVLRFESAVEQLRTYAAVMDTPEGFNPPQLSVQYAYLHALYQTELIETIPQSLVPEDKRSGLQFVQGTENSLNPKYIVPHDSEIIDPRGLYDPDPDQGLPKELPPILKPNSVMVHRRRILGHDSPEDLEMLIVGLNEIIDQYTERISGMNPGTKKSRLRNERRPYIRQRDKIQRALDELGDNVDVMEATAVSYEFFVSYQQSTNRNSEQIEFGLMPWNARALGYNSKALRFHSIDFDYAKFNEAYLLGSIRNGRLFSSQMSRISDTDLGAVFGADRIDYTKSNYGEMGGTGKRVMDTATIVDYFRNNFTQEGTDNPQQIQAGINEIKRRIDSLTNRITQIVTNKPPIVDDLLLPGLRELLDQQSELQVEFNNLEEEETVIQQGQEFSVQFSAHSIYSPRVVMREIVHPAPGKDRFDMIIEGDFFIGIPTREDSKKFSYCNQLPDTVPISFLQEDNYQTDGYFDKRLRFRTLFMKTLEQYLGFRPMESVNQDFYQFIANQFYKETTESILESLLDDLSESYLFDGQDVDSLDRRIVGKRLITPKNCVSNRFSFGDGSVVNFEKAILGDVTSEIVKEQMKPENSPQNYDFDTPTAFEKAMQKIAFKAYIRTCLMDLLLKGGLAYSTWDLEPIVSEEFFIDYAITYILHELETSDQLQRSWKINIEKITGISNPQIAVETLVREELLKLPNYSKQVFNPYDNSTNFYNWYIEKKIPHFHISKYSELTDNLPEVAKYDNRLYADQQLTLFNNQKQKFIIEHYIEMTGDELLTLYRSAIVAPDYQLYDVVYSGDTLRMNMIEFLTITRVLDRNDINEALLAPGNKISQVARLVLVDPAGIRNFIDGTRDTGKIISNIVENSGISSMENLDFMSRTYKSFHVSLQYQQRLEDDDPENDQQTSTGFAIPLALHKRNLDFADCYSALQYGTSAFLDAVPFMIQELTKKEETNLLLEHIFPTRRLMSMVSVFATSVVSGYNNMPTIFDTTKASLASLVNRLGMGRTQRAEMVTVSQAEFVKQLTENFPTDENACFEFPSGLEDMFIKFLKELGKLIKQMPSIIFRGVANQLDPAYKEMRQHYINCDINHLTFRGLKPAGTADYKLTNGLYLKGRSKDRTTEDVSHLAGQNKGKYVPLTLGFASDLGYALAAIPNFTRFGKRLGISIAKLVTYIYAGNRPFLDPSFYFKVPCKEIDTGAWRDQGKYDAGIYGRYGHPLTPFTLFALSTPQLEGDKRQKENNCIEFPQECVEVDYGNLPIPDPPREPREYHRPRGFAAADAGRGGYSSLDVQNPNIMGSPEQESDTRRVDYDECAESYRARVESGTQNRIMTVVEALANISRQFRYLYRTGYERTEAVVTLPGRYREEPRSFTEDELIEAEIYFNDLLIELKSMYSELELRCATADEYMELMYSGSDYDNPILEVYSLVYKLELMEYERAMAADRRR